MRLRSKKIQTLHIRRSFFLRNFLFTLALMLIPVFTVNTLLAVYTRHQLRQQAESQSLQALDYAQGSFNMVFDELFYYRNLFVSNSRLNLLLISTLNHRPLSYADTVSLRELYDDMTSLSSIKPSMESVYFGREGNGYMIVDGLRLPIQDHVDSAWYELYAGQGGEAPYWIQRRGIRDYFFEKEDRAVLTVFQRLKYDCVMVVNLNFDYFDQLLESSTTYEGQALVIMDASGEVILQNENAASLPQELLEAVWREDWAGDSRQMDGYVITRLESNLYGLSFVSLIPRRSIHSLPNLIFSLSLAIGLAAVLASALLSFLHTRRSYRQLSQIIDAFDGAEKGHTPPPAEYSGSNVYSYILNNTVNTFIRQSYLEMQLSKRRYEMLTAQMAALQYQINPHFLFNTLQSLDLEIQKSGSPSKASRMVGQLSDILRYSLGNPKEQISVSQEIAITKSYVEIQKYRHSSRFLVFWDTDESCLPHPIPRMLLQPLIENVIAHGMRGDGFTTLVRVRIRSRSGTLCFRITDNGLGIGEERLGEIRRSLQREGDDLDPRHIGLRNIHRRLRIQYPRLEGLSIWGREGLGCVVSFQVDAAG